jgi:hypothetical protein
VLMGVLLALALWSLAVWRPILLVRRCSFEAHLSCVVGQQGAEAELRFV